MATSKLQKTTKKDVSFKPKKKIDVFAQNTAEKYLGSSGGHFGSKSVYTWDNPRNLVVFNANLVTEDGIKIWYGDLDLTLDYQKIEKISREIGKALFVLPEMSARFENEANPKLDEFIYKVSTTKNSSAASLCKSDFYYFEMLTPRSLTIEEYKERHPEPKKNIKKYKESNYTRIKLPNLNNIKAEKGYSYVDAFQTYFISKYGKERAAKIYTNLFITPKYYELLKDAARKQIKKTFKYLHPAKVESQLGFEQLEMPISFESQPDWAKDQYGYVRKKRK